jgi:hypothetical protein
MTGAFVPMVSQSVVLAEVAVVKAGREKKKTSQGEDFWQ